MVMVSILTSASVSLLFSGILCNPNKFLFVCLFAGGGGAGRDAGKRTGRLIHQLKIFFS